MEKTKDRFETEIDKWMMETDKAIMTLKPTYEHPVRGREKDSETRLIKHIDSTYSVITAFRIGYKPMGVDVSVDIDHFNTEETITELLKKAYL